MYWISSQNMFKLLWWTLPFSAIVLFRLTNVVAISEEEMETLLAKYNQESIERCRRSALASWNVATDVGNQTKEMEEVQKQFITLPIFMKFYFHFFFTLIK